MKLRNVSYFVTLIGIALGVLVSVRAGALTIAAALAIFMAPEFRQMRTIEKVIPAALFVSLITIALALPRR
jgi:DhnA family fructose-bisphosphate aldolase class Ia